ncbi:DsrE family protein [Reyranella soli]|jgi:intracellular sulfur oxidation DsrE/DsrF family protein|uniref:Uncharacterized protein n=1 Tax=Reyranella soli TaxID=1230389 RepID=A0A512NIT4_9HYPH|nr:DsrE family protein [Reyranella soli]GEP58858.1 hypothetical protein RSO01_60240 [Reyranella soli]
MMFFRQTMQTAVVCLAGLLLMVPLAANETSEPNARLSISAGKVHRLAIQVNSAEPVALNLALNNATNVEEYYKNRGEKVEIEVVVFGAGLHMLREDTSPVKDRIKTIAETKPSISFQACSNTQENMHKAENKEIRLVSQAKLVKSGVVRLMELQEQGWSYIRP